MCTTFTLDLAKTIQTQAKNNIEKRKLTFVGFNTDIEHEVFEFIIVSSTTGNHIRIIVHIAVGKVITAEKVLVIFKGQHHLLYAGKLVEF